MGRSSYILYNNLLDTPFEKRRNREINTLSRRGAALFISAFAVWLVDCFACDSLTRAKKLVGKPTAFLLELHAWWHLGTGFASYLLSTALQLLVLSIQEDPRRVSLEWKAGGLLPYVARSDSKAIESIAKKAQ
ncbi:MAG: hypothetical protein CYPHOPRED_000689 [Cyphobasidiales sp. Tagirdzhanova-0007]|nr:MAG: hypothetical protein CYPHOPRED_000689 [Cyphobasidiales sp. Tagirdzhanova-0007]